MRAARSLQLILVMGGLVSSGSAHARNFQERTFQGSGLAFACSVPDPKNVATVEVKARPEDVKKLTVWNDCGIKSDDQFLESKIPVAQPPSRNKDVWPKSYEPDGGLPRRQKLCGAVRRYGVLDEQNDPRDIMIDVYPAPGFEHFVGGFVNTEMTPLKNDDEKVNFGSGVFRPAAIPPVYRPSKCKVDDCLRAAKDRKNKTVHCEITPADQFYGQDGRFLPISGDECSDSWGCYSQLEPRNQPSDNKPRDDKPWPNGKDICVYGVYALDHGADHGGPGSSGAHTTPCCSKDNTHDRPEIHPFDAIWFRHPERDGWIFGVFQDDSNRYSNPDCGDSNSNQWSQAPRDLTFRFPFKFPRSEAPKRACLRHIRTTWLIDASGKKLGPEHTIIPLNVSTKGLLGPSDKDSLTLVDGKQTVLSFVEPAGFGDETHVKITGGCFENNEVGGWIELRVAIGCSEQGGLKCKKADLQRWNPKGKHDGGDTGSGFYYAELTFEKGACPQ